MVRLLALLSLGILALLAFAQDHFLTDPKLDRAWEIQERVDQAMRWHGLEPLAGAPQSAGPYDMAAVLAIQSVRLLPEYCKRCCQFYAAPPKETGWRVGATLAQDREFSRSGPQDLAWLVRAFPQDIRVRKGDPQGLLRQIEAARPLLREATRAAQRYFEAGGWKDVPYPDTPDNHWAYEAVEGWKKTGFKLHTSLDGRLFRGNAPFTLKDMASIPFQVAGQLPAMLALAEHEFVQGGGDDRRWDFLVKGSIPQSFPAFAREFDWEMKELGLRPGDLAKSLIANRSAFDRLAAIHREEALLASLPRPDLTSARDRSAWRLALFPDVLENHWAYSTYRDWERRKLVPEHYVHTGGWPQTRAQFAQDAFVVASKLHGYIEAAATTAADQATTEKAGLLREESFFSGGIRQALSDFAEEFAPEMRLLGHDPAELAKAVDAEGPALIRLAAVYRHRMTVAGIRPLFNDVPGSHWAHEAVRELEGAGIVVGYPDGTFRGGR